MAVAAGGAIELAIGGVDDAWTCTVAGAEVEAEAETLELDGALFGADAGAIVAGAEAGAIGALDGA
ncbi:MAG: hypothetical protein WD971_01095 [Pirellulales bacterium]